MLEAGASVPDVQVWADVREEPKPLRELLGTGWSLLCFYLHDWSPT
jgi:peroxiredoxin